MVAKVIVDVNVKQLNRPFDYHVPADMALLIERGARVMVPFGARQVMGFVVALEDDSEIQTKSILQLLDVTPALTPELLDLGEQVAKDTSANVVAVYKLMLPSGLRVDVKSYVMMNDNKIYTNSLPPKELQALKQAKTPIHYEFKQKASTTYRTKVILKDKTYQPSSDAQARLLGHLASEDDAITLKKLSGTSAYKTLLQKGVIEEHKQEMYRNMDVIPEAKPVTLTADQQTALAQLQPGGNLLFGVTGSGKTEVYLAAIEHVLTQQKTAIFLVPEISLTYQTVARLVGRFGQDVAILHSGLSIGERYDEWRRIRQGDARVVVGARSAIFAPLENIGLIIVDEEHDSSYKQEDTPRYHAREVAIQRAQTHQAILLLGSATPSVETFARAEKGVYQLLRLPDRYAASLPSIEVVDLTQTPGVLSLPLTKAIGQSLQRNEQVLLLQNRRGFHNYMICQACGHVPKCPDCDVSLTYHQKAHSFVCHYCGHKSTPPTTCSMCHSEQLDYQGVGTEQLEALVKETFPLAKVLRMDRDTTGTKQAHETYLTAFEAQEYDILVGTQMIAKGLDFKNVGLVGVIDVDSMLQLPDFHSSERTYQLLTQVAGRAGRHLVAGHVIIQTYNPNHYAIQAVKQDYEMFYRTEMKYRQLAGYVPYFYVELLLLQGDVFQTVFQEALKIKAYLQQRISSQSILLGPVVPGISRLRQKYRVQLVLKYKREKGLSDVYASLLSLVQEGIDLTIDRTPTYIG
jgi:primosomal protein N' (replication factor Y) (superfamily II helicase)